MREIRLTELSHGAGCACKLGPGQLAEVLSGLDLPRLPPEVLVAQDTRDDAAVYRVSEDRVMVQTVDFFTPIVDDPYDWGRMAAANAASDVYAMGARPVLALNLVSWPVDELPLEMLREVLRGGAVIAESAGFAVVGGHSITDPEPKYGMVVTGFAAEAELVRNSTGRPGSVLYLTKPIGTGILTTALKQRRVNPHDLARAVATMTELNATASEAMVEGGADAATDVTGFGLVGHLRSMAEASGAAACVDAAQVPLLPAVRDLAEAGVVPGGTRRNHAYLRDWVDWGDLEPADQAVLADAQTSGGLLVSAPDPERMERAFLRRGIRAARVGVLEEGTPGKVTVRGRLGSSPE